MLTSLLLPKLMEQVILVKDLAFKTYAAYKDRGQNWVRRALGRFLEA